MKLGKLIWNGMALYGGYILGKKAVGKLKDHLVNKAIPELKAKALEEWKKKFDKAMDHNIAVMRQAMAERREKDDYAPLDIRCITYGDTYYYRADTGSMCPATYRENTVDLTRFITDNMFEKRGADE